MLPCPGGSRSRPLLVCCIGLACSLFWGRLSRYLLVPRGKACCSASAEALSVPKGPTHRVRSRPSHALRSMIESHGVDLHIAFLLTLARQAASACGGRGQWPDVSRRGASNLLLVAKRGCGLRRDRLQTATVSTSARPLSGLSLGTPPTFGPVEACPDASKTGGALRRGRHPLLVPKTGRARPNPCCLAGLRN